MKQTKQQIINETVSLIKCMYTPESGLIQHVVKGLNKMTWDQANNLLFLIKLNNTTQYHNIVKKDNNG